MSKSSTANGLPNVVIVGGGGAGADIAHGLSAKVDPSKYNLIMITARPHYLNLIACIRMVVTPEGKYEEKALIPYDNNFVNGNCKVVVGTVTAIEEQKARGGEVVLASGERMPYSVLVLSPGSTWEGPLAIPNTKGETVQWVNGWRTRFERAEHIVLVGGGAVGIEYAGELKDFYPHKKVTLVHAENMLLNDAYPTKFRAAAEKKLRARGVDIILGDRIDQLPESGSGSVTTLNGVTLTADLFVMTRGPRPNTSFISSSLGSSILSPTGYVKIEPTMQIAAHPSIFAAGDIIDFPEQKQVGKYGGHSAVVIANVLDVLAGQPPKAIYKKQMEAIFVTIGRTGGAGYIDALWGILIGDWLVALIKSKGLFVNMARKKLGLPALAA